MTITVTLLFWLMVGSLPLFALSCYIAFKIHTSLEEDFRESRVSLWSQVNNLNINQDALTSRVDNWEDAQDHFESMIDEEMDKVELFLDDKIQPLNELPNRLEELQMESQRSIDFARATISNEVKLLVAKCQAAMEEAEEKLLQRAHRSVWEDLDGTLTTIRADFDASLNQRTNSITNYVDKSILNFKSRAGLEAIEELQATLEMVKSDLDAVRLAIDSSVVTNESYTRTLEMVDDHNDRISKMEITVEELENEVADITIESNNTEVDGPEFDDPHKFTDYEVANQFVKSVMKYLKK